MSGSAKYYSVLKRILVLFLSFSILAGIISTPALAAVSATKNNSEEKNQEILKTLKGICGDDNEAQKILDTMNSLGIVDENGNFVTDAIHVDGKKMSLDEVRKLVSAPDTDLSKVVTVDGTALTLKNLKTMIGIEDEIQRIKDTYFSDNVTLSAEQTGALASIQAQMDSDGIQLLSASDSVTAPSGIDHMIYAEVDHSAVTCDNGSGSQTGATVTLKDKDGKQLSAVPNYDISISYRFVNGSAVNGTNYTGSNGTLTFKAGSSETTKAVPFSINNDSSRFNGQKTFLIQLYDPQNIVLKNNMLAAEMLIRINKQSTWKKEIPYIFYPSFPGSNDNNRCTEYYTAFTLADDDMSMLLEKGIFNKATVDFKITSGHFDSSYYDQHFKKGIDNSLKVQFHFGCKNGKQNWGKIVDLGTIETPKTDSIKSATTDLSDSIYTDMYNSEKYFKKDSSGNYIGYTYHGYCDLLVTDTSMDHLPEKDSHMQCKLLFYDDRNPYITDVSVPQGINFQYGESVPITVTYSEPVNLTNVAMTANGQTLYPLERSSTGVRKATFLYTVKEREDSSASIQIGTVTGASDLSSHGQDSYSRTELTFGLTPLSRYYSFSTAASASAEISDEKMTGTVSLSVSNNDLTKWIDSSQIDKSDGKSRIKSVCASTDGGKTKIPLYCDEDGSGNFTGLSGTFTPGWNTTGAEAKRAIEFYYTEDGTTYKLMVGKCAVYTVEPAVFLTTDDFSISYDKFPADGTVFAQDGTPLSLSYKINKDDATWKSAGNFAWSSNHPEIATIDKNGKISIVGKEGDVTFTLTAKNGGLKTADLPSRTLTVKVGLTPFLNIPEGTNQIAIQAGQDAEVRWTSNLIAKYAESNREAEFSIKVYKAKYNGNTPEKGEQVGKSQTVTGSTAKPVASYIIPSSILTDVSHLGQCSYIVEVSAINPYDNKTTLTATAYISVASKPASVQLEKLQNYFITDATKSLPISWTLQNFDTVNTANFALEITRNSDGASVYKQAKTENDGGSYTFDIPKVTNGYRDIYTVTVKARNSTLDPAKNDNDSTWSYDSFVLYVYSDQALKIWIDGKAAEPSLTMSNVKEISKMSSEEILALKRDIYLKNVVSINYGDHAWGMISDQIKWKSSDDGVASINYKDISTYSDINDLGYSSYRPSESFILSGLKDGSTTVTATHAATGKEVSLNVKVETLKDKLYLFQLYPQAKTSLTYTNGKGEQRTVETNDNGELALYEESGIKSEISMKSTSGGKDYMGTLYSGLVSSEKDSTKLELYPVNYFKLREVATAELYFKNPDGTAFSGSVTLRGGVYKNGKYCTKALLNEKKGTEDQTITIGSDGKFTVKMDATQFWSKSDKEVLDPSDKLDFIFEVRFPDDKYYPRLLDVHCNTGVEDAIKFGDKTVNVEAVPDGEKDKPFLVSQYVDYGYASGALMNVQNSTGKIGPGQSSDEAKLYTTVLWWGEALKSDNSKHTLTLKDEFGITPAGQTSESLIYPFSTIKATRNTFVMNRKTMDGWLKSGDSRGMTLFETAADGSQYKTVTLPFRVTNMLDIEKAEKSGEITSWYGGISDYFSANSANLLKDIGGGDDLMESGLSFLCKLSIDDKDTAGMFSIKLAPTADPTVFSAFICLNLGNMSNDNVTGIYTENDIDSDIDAEPALTDIIAMQKGTYLKDQKKTLAKNALNKTNGSGNISYSFGGYMEAEVRFNADKGKWEFNVLNGGFNAGGGYSYNWNYNTSVGGVPVTAQLTLGGTAEVTFKAAVQRGKYIETQYHGADSINTYLTTLRIYAYARAFAGLGFDLSVVALKIGLFGQISADVSFNYLNRPYKSSTATERDSLSIDGKVGIEFVAKFLFVSYEKVLASAHYNFKNQEYGSNEDVRKTWKDIKDDPYPTDPKVSQAPKGLRAASPGGTNSSQTDALSPVYSTTEIESRDYLNESKRTWSSSDALNSRLMSCSPDEVKDLQTNAYPYSNPVVTKDGNIMMYVSDLDSSDVEKTQVCWTKYSGGGYPNGSVLSADPGGGHGDSQLKLAGDKSFAAAAWVRQSQSINKDAGDAVTNADIALMSSSTEIMAAIFDGADWTVTKLTDNAVPDLAPAVATSGNYAFVAWRCVYAASSSNPLNFDGADTILYKIYDKTTKKWSDPQTLYNGTSGAVKGLEASMLSDGTAGVAYTIAANDAGGLKAGNGAVNSNLETVFSVVGTNGTVTKNIRLTNDTYLDENPQITTVKLGGAERFVVGWFSEHDADGVKENDIRLCAVDQSGAIYDHFIDSISSINANASVDISDNFRFVSNAGSIDGLSILWTETENTDDSGDQVPEHDVLKAVKFMDDGGKIYITAPLTLAEMSDYTLIDFFCPYNAQDNSVKAVLLGTNYNNGTKTITIPASESGSSTDETVTVAKAISNLYTASGSYENSVGVSYAAVDYTSIVRGSQIPVQFSVYNAGIQPITGITLKMGTDPKDTTEYSKDFSLLPNESKTLTAYYNIPSDKLTNPEYTVTAAFESGSTDVKTGRLYLDIPDIGISKLEPVSSESGKRVMQVTLYNASDSVLADSARTVKIGFYSDEACTVPVTQVNNGEPFTVDAKDLSMIDAGAYTHQFTFDIGSYVGAGKEIPDGGIRIYAKAWVEEQIDPSHPKKGTDAIEEYDAANNTTSLLFESLLAGSKGPVTITAEQTNTGGGTEADITLKNNSLVNTSSGNLIVSLLDSNGNILESKQSFHSGSKNNGLISLSGEGKVTKEFTFSKKGASLTVTYSNAVLDEKNNAKLASLSMSGIQIQLQSGVTEYSVSANEIGKTLVSAIAEDPSAKVTINGRPANVGNIPIMLFNGKNEIDITVTAADGKTTLTYKVKIKNRLTGTASIPTQPTKFHTKAANGSATLNILDTDIEDLIKSAESSGKKEIQIEPTIDGKADKVIFELSAKALKELVTSGKKLSLDIPAMDMLMDTKALSDISGQKKNIQFVADSGAGKTSISVMADDKPIAAVSGGITVRMPASNADSGTVAMLEKVDGQKEPIKMSVFKNGILTVPLRGTSVFTVVENAESFNDTDSHWAKDYINFVSSRDLFHGTGESRFSPDATMTRGMVVTALGRLGDAVLSGSADTGFKDVGKDAFYAKYAAWAVQNNIVKGDDKGRFMGEQPITREQLATILSNFISSMGLVMDKQTSASTSFSDADTISDYAKSAVSALAKEGIIKGKTGNTFDPKGTATRAEVATMLEKLVENIAW